jgi:hypothetical protein
MLWDKTQMDHHYQAVVFYDSWYYALGTTAKYSQSLSQIMSDYTVGWGWIDTQDGDLQYCSPLVPEDEE